MPKIKINQQDYEVPAGLTLLQAARVTGHEIPVFCYHDRLAIAGNCRMCLVEVDNVPKPVASCAQPVTEGISFYTQSDKTAQARKHVLEFLLINHPLDCPICDQGGECDLQDITMAYGPSTSRFQENKRAVTPKPMGPIIKTFMNRCIQCTRCVRFITDVAGVPELGAVGRGENMEILSYVNSAVTSELSGNVIDLCPVGALTSKPYAYRGRPWELTKTDSIDVMDALGSAIRIDSHNMTVVRILPRLNEDINEEWLADKSRYACDGLTRQRLDRPYVRNAQGRLEEASWTQALMTVVDRLHGISGERLAAIAGDMIDVEAMVALKDLWQALGATQLECRQDGTYLDPHNRASYVFNSTIAGIDETDFCLLIGANLRTEAPLLAARLRKRYSQIGLNVAYLGGELSPYHNLTFPHANLSDDPLVLNQLLQGEHELVSALQAAQKPMIILGQEPLKRTDAAVIMRKIYEICQRYAVVKSGWNGFNVLHKAAARVGGLDVGFHSPDPTHTITTLLQNIHKGEIDVLYLLGSDDVQGLNRTMLGSTFVIYQGHHGDSGAQLADVILPGCAYTEKDATYVNTEGRPQLSAMAVAPPGKARCDWQIISDLARLCGHPLSYTTLAELRQRMIELNPLFAHSDDVQQNPWAAFGDAGHLEVTLLNTPTPHYYMTDSISRHSPTMAKCIEEIEKPLQQKVCV